MILKKKPIVIIGSPPCTAWSQRPHLKKYWPRREEKLAEMRKQAEKHLRLCAESYLHQVRQGMHFVHGHPADASSWQVSCIQKVARAPGVMINRFDQCAYGLKSKDVRGEAPARKPTKIMAISVAVNREMRRRCPGCERHVVLEGGRAAKAARHPKELCMAICRGIKKQLAADSAGLMIVGVEGELNQVEVNEVAEEWKSGSGIEWLKYWDNVSGEPRDAKLVEAARTEEHAEVKRMGVWEKGAKRTMPAREGPPTYRHQVGGRQRGRPGEPQGAVAHRRAGAEADQRVCCCFFFFCGDSAH